MAKRKDMWVTGHMSGPQSWNASSVLSIQGGPQKACSEQTQNNVDRMWNEKENLLQKSRLPKLTSLPEEI